MKLPLQLYELIYVDANPNQFKRCVSLENMQTHRRWVTDSFRCVLFLNGKRKKTLKWRKNI